MRLHRLTVTAFGPFAGREEVDFDELNEAGLFLLTGPTGAGKSSLLDAVCFALYGTVPGARGVKTLKSQHAAAHVEPEVTLDFGVQGRRFVVRRTPEWSRPKKRGEGLLAEKASASVLETTDGSERLLSARAAEVGLLIGELMGMNAAQFQQVALLPQGEFQTFLRASSQERHAVLQHLFRTDRFSRIEDWVNEHSRLLKSEAGDGESAVRRLLDTVADRTGATVPEALAGERLAAGAADGLLLPWVAQLHAASTERQRLAEERAAMARHAVAAARRRHGEASALAALRVRRDESLAALASLAETEESAVTATANLSAHARAQDCRPVLTVLGEAVRGRQDADRRHRDAVAAVARTPRRLAALLDGPHRVGVDADDWASVAALDAERLADVAVDVRHREARLVALLPREREAVTAAVRLEADLAAVREAEADHLAQRRRRELLPAELGEVARELAEATAGAARHEGLTASLDAARSRHRAAVDLLPARAQLLALADDRRDARDRAQDAREQVQDLQARRLAGMAAELAGALVAGEPCQVCGSPDHPLPARTAPDAVSSADQRVAESHVRTCTEVLESVEADLRTAQTRCELLEATSSGQAPESLAVLVTDLTGARAGARQAAHDRDRLTAQVRALSREQEDLGHREAVTVGEVAALRQSVAGHQRTIAEVAAELEDALVAGGVVLGVSATDLAAELALLAERLEALRRAREALSETGLRAGAVEARARETASGHGFADLADVEAALLPDDRLHRLRGLLRDRETIRSRAEAVLDDPALAEVDRAADPGALAEEVASLERISAQAEGELALRLDETQAVGRHHDRLVIALESWAPLRDRSLRADSMSRLVRGMGTDNQLQMRLSAYVLATRLDQVVDAANERLGHMRDHRYLLQRTGRAERRSAQAGLGLEIVDQWTGDVRAPTTLSGGETFVVSLALALGLADVVTHEAGGTEIETLFVDEGFGTLDADTLDDVMDRLDGLRAGGRTVGVVSHVTELRSRIPTQVQVDKGRGGSSVTVRTLVG